MYTLSNNIVCTHYQIMYVHIIKWYSMYTLSNNIVCTHYEIMYVHIIK